MDEDEWLMIAVEAMGMISALPLDHSQAPASVKCLNPECHAELDIIGTPPGRPILVRYLVWGLYSSIKGIMAINKFCEASFFLKWDGLLVGHVAIRTLSPSLPERNMTGTLPQMSSSNQSSDFLVGSFDVADSTYSIPLKSPKLQLVVTHWGEDLPRNDIVSTIVEVLYTTASATPRDRIPDAIIVMPAPFTVQLHIIPYPMTQGQVNLTAQVVALSVSQIPQIMLSKERWREMHFDIKAGDDDVALGLLVKPGVTSESTVYATSTS